MSSLLIAITGPDGSGKSTAASKARALLAAQGISVEEVSVWDCLRGLGDSTLQPFVSPPFASIKEAQAYLGDLDGTSRTLFIFHALARALQLGQRKEPQVLLLSGYWFKYAVSEIGYGVDPDFVLGAASGFARPDHVICLDIDPATAWERRKAATDYEQGGASGASGAERFIAFQTKLRKAWAGIEAQSGQDWEHLSALDPADQVAEQIVAAIRLRLRRPS